MPRRPHRRLSLVDRIKDGHIFQKSGISRDGRTTYLRCQKKTICHGTAKLVNGEIEQLHPHSEFCLPDESAVFIARFKQALADSLAIHWYKLKTLYDSLATVHPEAAAAVSFQSIRSFMKRCRRKLYPPCPRNVEEFVDRLADPAQGRNLEYDTGRFRVRLVTDANGAKHVLLYDEHFVRTEMAEVSKLLIDATFGSRPRIEGVYQLLTIMGIKFNHGFPFVWVIMTKKTQAAYTAVLEAVKENVLPNNRISLVMSDFERGLRNAISAVFTGAYSTGCNTHYDRALYHKAKTLHLQNLLRTNADANGFLKKILALAYLPADAIDAQYRVLRNGLTGNLRRQFSQFCLYFDRYWLHTVGPAGFSVYGLGRRTNNIIESYHSRLGHRMENRPGPWDFICKLLRLQSDVKTDIQRLRNNKQISRHPRYATVYKQKELVRAWRQLHLMEITVDEFMQKAASLKGNVNAIIRRTFERGGHEYELQDPPVIVPLEQDPDYEQDIFADERPHWLLDNAEAAPVAPPEHDSGDDDSDGDELDSSNDQDVPEGVEVPNLIEDIDPLPEAHFVADDGRQSPLIVDYDPLPNVPFIEEDGRQSPLIDIIDLDPPPNAPLIAHDGRQSPPIDIIDLDPPPNSPLIEHDGRQSPPIDIIDLDPPPNSPLIENDGRQSPLDDIFENIDPPLGLDLSFVESDGRLSPPTDNIDDIRPPQDVATFDEPGRQTPNIDARQNAPVGEEDRERSQPEVVIVNRRRKRKRRRRQSREQIPIPPTEPASEKNKKRNKRRKEMKRRAYARRAEEAAQTSEAAQLRGQLQEMQNQLQVFQHDVERTENNASCRICYEARATHTFWPCGHRCSCAECVNILWYTQGQRRCPVCRTESTDVPRRVWLPTE